jgi:hypothetical protein
MHRQTTDDKPVVYYNSEQEPVHSDVVNNITFQRFMLAQDNSLNFNYQNILNSIANNLYTTHTHTINTDANTHISSANTVTLTNNSNYINKSNDYDLTQLLNGEDFGWTSQLDWDYSNMIARKYGRVGEN